MLTPPSRLGDIQVRIILFATLIAVTGCAGQPSAPPTRYVATEAPAAAVASSGGQGAAPAAERLATARKMGYTVVNTNGEVLYCRSDLKTGSHVQRDTTCLTADQLQRLHDQTRDDLQNGLKVNSTLPMK